MLVIIILPKVFKDKYQQYAVFMLLSIFLCTCCTLQKHNGRIITTIYEYKAYVEIKRIYL